MALEYSYNGSFNKLFFGGRENEDKRRQMNGQT